MTHLHENKIKIGRIIKIDECKKSAKYQIRRPAKLPQVPGAGFNKPMPNHGANI